MPHSSLIRSRPPHDIAKIPASLDHPQHKQQERMARRTGAGLAIWVLGSSAIHEKARSQAS